MAFLGLHIRAVILVDILVPLLPPRTVTNCLPSGLWELGILLDFVSPVTPAPFSQYDFSARGEEAATNSPGQVSKEFWRRTRSCSTKVEEVTDQHPLLFPKEAYGSSEGEKSEYRPFLPSVV